MNLFAARTMVIVRYFSTVCLLFLKPHSLLFNILLDYFYANSRRHLDSEKIGVPECTIHKGEPEPLRGNVNTVYFINQARANTRISRTEFMYDERMRLQMVTSCLEKCS